MADTAAPTAATSGPPVSVDPHDPLPESSWLWRRVFVFVFAGVLLAFQWWYVGALGNVALSTDPHTPKDAILASIKALISLLERDQLLMALLILLYIAGASMEQITKLVQTSSLLKNVNFTSRTAAIGPDGSRAAASTTSSPNGAPDPAAPPPVPEAEDEEDVAPSAARAP